MRSIDWFRFSDLTFSSILHFISPAIHEKTKNKNLRRIVENVLPNHLNKVVNFTRENHEEWAVRFSMWACVNIFHNNKQKITNESVRKDQIKDFKRDKQRIIYDY